MSKRFWHGSRGYDHHNGDDKFIFGHRGGDTFHLKGDKDNFVFGGRGRDNLDGGRGNDTLTGGRGADIFTIRTDDQSVDTVTDFKSGKDKLYFALIFTGLWFDAFALGTAAADETDRIIYDQTTGTLFFDGDGSLAGQEQHVIGRLNPGSVLDIADLI